MSQMSAKGDKGEESQTQPGICFLKRRFTGSINIRLLWLHAFRVSAKQAGPPQRSVPRSRGRCLYVSVFVVKLVAGQARRRAFSSPTSNAGEACRNERCRVKAPKNVCDRCWAFFCHLKRGHCAPLSHVIVLATRAGRGSLLPYPDTYTLFQTFESGQTS